MKYTIKKIENVITLFALILDAYVIIASLTALHHTCLRDICPRIIKLIYLSVSIPFLHCRQKIECQIKSALMAS